MTIAFDFVDSAGQSDFAGAFIFDVPEGLQSKAVLLEALANGGHFPCYFGNNWDAFAGLPARFQLGSAGSNRDLASRLAFAIRSPEL